MTNRARGIITALLTLVPLLGWWTTGLFDLDEGFYGAVVSEMNRRGEWITPYYNGQPWFEKPILLYWLAKPCLLLFGEMVGPRLPSVLTTLATYAVVFAFSKRWFGEKVAHLATLILAGSLLVVIVGRQMMTDAPLLLAMTVAFLSFWESLVGDRRWRLLTAAAIGVGVLAKGPVACLLFLPVAAWTWYREPQLRAAFRGQWLGGIILLALVVASWYGPAYAVNGQVFVQKFLIEQNLERFTGGDAAHTIGPAGLILFIPIILLGMVPWSLSILKAWPRRPKHPDDAVDPNLPALRYLATWAAWVFLFFTLSGAKLVHYVLPLTPALAVLIAYRLQDRGWAMRTAQATCIAVSVIANLGIPYWYSLSGQAEAHQTARYLRAQGGSVAVYQLPRRQKSLGTGKPTLQETSLPSVLLYLNHPVLMAENLTEILAQPAPIWILTRTDRIHPEDFAAAERAGKHLEWVRGAPTEKHYRVYRVTGLTTN